MSTGGFGQAAWSPSISKKGRSATERKQEKVRFCGQRGLKRIRPTILPERSCGGEENVAEIRGGKSFLQLTCMVRWLQPVTDYVFNASEEEWE